MSAFRVCLLSILITSLPSILYGQPGGTVVVWGDNENGQNVAPNGLSNNVTAIAVGFGHVLAVKVDGTVVGWGRNDNGQTVPPPGLTGVTAVAAGGGYSVALKSDGTVVAWGYNGQGQTLVPAGLSNVTAIAAGNGQVAALKSNGTVVAWGFNGQGETNVPAGLTNVTAIACGANHTIALKSDGTIVAWGNNAAPNGLTNITAIAAGNDQALAVKSDGTVLVWGSQTQSLSGLTNAVAVAAGASHMLALRSDGTVVAWGDNGSGQTNVPAGLVNVTAIAADWYNSAALWQSVPAPPSITTQPTRLTVNEGGIASFNVIATGSSPLRYQWRKNSAAISGATNSGFALASVMTSNSGDYDVVITNLFGSVTSSVANLLVWPSNAPNISINGTDAVSTVTCIASANVTLYGGFLGGFIFYTLDGTAPTTSDNFYTGPFSVTSNATLRAMSLSADFSQSSEAPTINLIVLPGYPVASSVSGSGTVIASPSNGPYISNSVVMLTAQASANWAFDHWSGDLSGNANPANLTMNGPKNVEAVFTPTAYPLTIATPGGGTVTADGQSIAPATYYPTGAIVSLAATPSSGWSFVRWQGSVTSSSNPLNLTINQSNSVQAIFATVVGTTVAGNGSIHFNLSNIVEYGASVSVTAVPNTKNFFVTWNLAASGTNNPTSFVVTNATPTVGALFAVSPAPTILTQPSNLSVVLGSSVTFSVSATGTQPLSYQWRKGSTNLSNATNALFSIPVTVAGDTGGYDVVVINAYGSSSTSAVATLTVLLPPTIATPPASQFVLLGSNALFSVTAAGTPPFDYQWQKEGVPISGVTSATYSILGVASNDSGAFRVAVSNLYGSITSAAAMLTIVYPPVITNQTTNLIVAQGTPAAFSVNAMGTDPLSYQWVKPATNLLTNVVVWRNGFEGGTGSRTVSQGQIFADGWVVNSGNVDLFFNGVFGQTADSGSFCLDLNGTLAASISTNITTTPGTSYTLTLAFTKHPDGQLPSQATFLANGVPFLTLNPTQPNTWPNLNWQHTSASFMATSSNTMLTVRSDNAGAYGVIIDSLLLTQSLNQPILVIPDATNASFVIPSAQTNDSGPYQVIVSNPYAVTTSAVAQLFVYIPAAITAQPQSVLVPAEGDALFTATATGYPALAYQWLKDGTNLAGSISNTLTVTNVGLEQLGVYSLAAWNAEFRCTFHRYSRAMGP